MNTNYDSILTRLLKDEGGYGDDPRDPGGPTNYGITLADYRLYINRNGTANDVRRMTVDQAKLIYKKQYWDALNCDSLPSGVDYCVFDYGVNSGIGRARKVLAKFKAITDPIKLINAICDERMAFLRSLGTFSTFGAGWTRRVSGVRNYSLQLAHQPTIHPVATHAATAAVATATAGAVVAAHPDYWPYVAAAAVIAFVIGLGILTYKEVHK